MREIMLGAISWGSYIAAVIVLLLLWYGYLLARFYWDKVKDVFKGKAGMQAFKMNAAKGRGPFAEFDEPFDTLEDAEELFGKIVKIIAESAQRNISRTEFLNYVSFVLQDYPFVKQSAIRDKINSLMAAESQKHPLLALTFQEADSLWEFEE